MPQRSARNIAWLEDRADGSKKIVGYAAVYYNPDDPGTEFELWRYGDDRCVERIMPGAFDRAMKEGDDCRALFNHNPHRLLGRRSASTLKLKVDRIGLRFEVTPPETAAADDVLQAIERGDLTGCSFTFAVDKDGQKWISQGGRTVREIHSFSGLFDVGPVTFPAYESTSCGVRSDGPRAARLPA
jgi:HK97 family phage prohead protease